VKGSSQQTGSTTYSFSYAYNKAGGLETQTYPSGLLVKTCYDAAGRISGVSDNATPAASYASEFGYAAHGALAELKLGNNLYEYRDYNTRLQPQEIGLGTFDGGSDKLKLEFTYKTPNNNDNNGNVLKQVITRPSLTALTQSYGYDKVNRLISAAESGAGTAWSRSYGYDRYGNRAVTANSGLPTSPLMPTATTNFSTSTNRLTLTGAGYDNSGNLTATSLGDTLAYDAENRLTSYTLSSATTSYKYGPQGRRVQKVTPTVTETYVYDAFGKLAAEYSTAAPTSGGTFYRTTDHLGSTRLVTKQDKSDADCYDFAPFGEEIPNTLGSRSSNACFAASFDGRHRFTGKERDDESDLDYFLARYYSGPMGRFTSADEPFVDQHAENPQSWNLYQYGYNNPLANVDIDGRSVWTKIGKVTVKLAKGADVTSAFADNIQDAKTLINPAATPLEKFIAGASLLSEALPVSASDLKDAGRLLKAAGGRLGKPSMRELNQKIGELARQQGGKVTGGANVKKEEFVPSAAGTRKGSSFVDATVELSDGTKVRAQTVDTLKDGVTPTKRERRNTEKLIRNLNAQGESSPNVILVPKPKLRKRPDEVDP
jgi:RHS repeat-associated protein